MKFIVLVPIPTSNSPALDLMGVASHLQARGHAVLVVTTLPDAFQYLRRAAARHTSNTTAEAMRYLAAAGEGAAAEAVGPAAASAVAAAPPAAPPATAARAAAAPAAAQQRSWKVPSSWLGRALQGPHLILAMQESMAALCGQMLLNATVMQALRHFGADAILPLVLLPTGPSLARDSCGCVLSAALGVPYAEVDAPLATLWVNPLTTPQFGTGLTPADLQRPWKHPGAWLLNLATWAALQLLPAWADMFSTPKAQSFAALRARLALPPAASYSRVGRMLDSGHAAVHALPLRRDHGTSNSQQCRPLLRVLPGSWLFEFPRPLQPEQLLVGPGSPRPAQPLTHPPDAAAFVAGATAGLVLVGFGTGKISNDSAWLRPVDFQQLARAFASLAPIRVLWNLQGGLPAAANSTALGSNTLVVGWVDYNDVLGHPHTRAFVTHCGLHSAYEALYHGVPLVGFPFMFEQVHTCNKVVWRGAAVVSPEAPAWRSPPAQGLHFTAEGVGSLIMQVLSDGRFAGAAARASQALTAYAARRHPYARAADAIEVALAVNNVQTQRRRRRQPPQRRQPSLTAHAGDAGGEL